jgi:hypothetical protein
MSCLLACVSGAPSVTVTSNGLPVMRANDETGVRRFGAGSFFADCDSINSQSARKLRISVASSKALDGCLTGDTARPTGIPDMSSRMRAVAHDLPRCWSPRHTGRPRFFVILEVQGGGLVVCTRENQHQLSHVDGDRVVLSSPPVGIWRRDRADV